VRRRDIHAALRRRVRGPYAALGRLDARLHDVQQRLARTEAMLAAAVEELAALRAAGEEGREVARHSLAVAQESLGETRAAGGLLTASHELLSDEFRPLLRAIVSEESANRRRLHELRADPEYGAPWEEEWPLVSVTVATRDRAALLAERCLPSLLGQSYPALEVIVVGDHADEDTAEAVGAVGDERVIYRNLTQRLDFTDDRHRHWLVASTMARNEAMRLARGRWVMCFDDDDAMRPDCVERLLARAREERLEAVYGQAMLHRDSEPEFAIGTFPPRLGGFTWASGMYHGGLRFFERETYAADLGLPGDWFLASRMLRAGVRFGMIEDCLSDVYPSPMNLARPDEAGHPDPS